MSNMYPRTLLKMVYIIAINNLLYVINGDHYKLAINTMTDLAKHHLTMEEYLNIQTLMRLQKLPLSLLSHYIPSFQCEDYCFQGNDSLWVNSFDPACPNTVLFFHGGGYHMGNAHMYQYMGREIFDILNASPVPSDHPPVDGKLLPLRHPRQYNVLIVDYKKAPQYKHPTAILESLNIYQSLVAVCPDTNYYLVGESAGGHLALQLTHQIVSKAIKPPAKVLVYSPWCVSSYPKTAQDVKETDYVCHVHEEIWRRNYTGFPVASPMLACQHDASHEADSHEEAMQTCTHKVPPSLLDLSYTNFPPTIVDYGTEYLQAEIEALVSKMSRDGCPVRSCHCKDMPHSFILFYPLSEKIKKVFHKSVLSLRAA